MKRVLTALGLLTVWALTAFAVAVLLFLNSSTQVVIASHDAALRPTLDGEVVVNTGPVLPDLRLSAGTRLGVEVTLGKTEATSFDDLAQRYALLASQPQGQIDKAEDALVDLAVGSVLRGAAVGVVPIVAWFLVGRERRRDLWRRSRRWRLAEFGLVLLLAGVVWWQPWEPDQATVKDQYPWMPLSEFLGAGVPLPASVADVEVRGDITTNQTRRLVESAISTFDQSKTFYDEAAKQAAKLDLHRASEDDTVVAVVSDRHDNIGMDRVARAIADAGGATAVYDLGDDTSTGRTWEAFSLDSVVSAFDGLPGFGVAGNHDSGSFVSSYLADHGWTMMDGSVLEGPDGVVLLGLDDPRSSGLGNWRDETGLSFVEVGARLSSVACESDERVTTMLVHDANLAADALAGGCVDLVLGGHTHVTYGPIAVTGTNGSIGYRFTTGTTGGAAYAIAIGSKPRRPAVVSLVTYRDGRPIGIQAVTLQTDGRFEVGEWTPITPS